MISIFLFYVCSQLFVSVMDNNELFLIMFIWKMMFLCWLETVVHCLILIIRVSKFFFLTCCNSSDSSEIDISFQFYVLRFETIFFLPVEACEFWTKRGCHAIVRVKYMLRSRRINNGGMYETKDEISRCFQVEMQRARKRCITFGLASSREQCSCAMLSYDVLTEILIPSFVASLFTSRRRKS